MKASDEECDDGDTDGLDGCDSNCNIELNSYCDFGFEPNKCDVCGNNFVNPPETCDDGI